MLSIERLKIVAVQDLKPGDIARLPDQNNALVIATHNQRNPFVFLERAPENFELVDRDDFYGPALVYEGVRFEVHPLSATRSSSETGCLSMYSGELVLTVKSRGHDTFASIRTGFESSSSMRLFFTKWRALIRDEDGEHVLFDHEAGSDRPFTLEITPEMIEHYGDILDLPRDPIEALRPKPGEFQG